MRTRRKPALRDARHDRRFVEALARGLAVLDCWRPDDRELGNGEIAARTGLPAATVSRLTFTLTALDYLAYVPERGRYAPGPGLLSLGPPVLARLDVRSIARPFMRAFAEEIGATVSLAVRHGTSVVYIEVCRAIAPLVLAVEVGGRVPLATTAHGRAHFVTLDAAARESLLQELEACDPAAARRDRRGLERALHDHAARGFVTSEDEWEPGISAVALPLALDDASGNAVTLSCGGPSAKLARKVLVERAGPRLRQVAAEIEAACAASARQRRRAAS